MALTSYRSRTSRVRIKDEPSILGKLVHDYCFKKVKEKEGTREEEGEEDAMNHSTGAAVNIKNKSCGSRPDYSDTALALSVAATRAPKHSGTSSVHSIATLTRIKLKQR